MRAVNSPLNSASTVSIFSTSIASGYPFLVPGDMSMLCVSSFMARAEPVRKESNTRNVARHVFRLPCSEFGKASQDLTLGGAWKNTGHKLPGIPSWMPDIPYHGTL